MRRIRATPEEPRQPEPVVPEAPPPPAPIDLQPTVDAMNEVAQVARNAFEQMAKASRAVTDKATTPAAPPKLFRCTVSERDTGGRIKSIDIEVKG